MPIVFYVATKSKAIAFYRQITLNGTGSARRNKIEGTPILKLARVKS